MTYYKLKHRINGSVCYAIQITGDNDSELMQFMEHFFGKEFLTSIDASYKLDKKYQNKGEWIIATPALYEENIYKYWWTTDDYKVRNFEQLQEIEHIKIDGTKIPGGYYWYNKKETDLFCTKIKFANSKEKDDEETAEPRFKLLQYFKCKHKEHGHSIYAIPKSNLQEITAFQKKFNAEKYSYNIHQFNMNDNSVDKRWIFAVLEPFQEEDIVFYNDRYIFYEITDKLLMSNFDIQDAIIMEYGTMIDEETAPEKEKKHKRKKDSLFFYKLKHRDSSADWYGMRRTGKNQQELSEFLDAFSVEFKNDSAKNYFINLDWDWLVLCENKDKIYEWYNFRDDSFKEMFKIIEEIEFCGDSKKVRFKRELSGLINQYNYDTKADTYDFVLADYLYNCLKNYIKANKKNNELLLNEEL